MYYSNLPEEEKERLTKIIVKTLFEHLSVFVTDAQGNFVFTTEQFARGLCLTPEEVLSSSVQEMIRRNIYTKSATLISLQTGKNGKTATITPLGQYHIGQSTLLYNKQNKIEYVLTEGMNIPNVITLIDEMMDQSEESAEITHIRKKLYGKGAQIIFQSVLMQGIIQKSNRIAAVDSNVVITGESGVGKDLLAQYIHNSSTRKDRRFIPVCIPLIQPSLLESELFGYVGGAFTNANKEGKMGLFEMANGGTVFLDEIGDIHMDMQVKLLRVLENREIFRVGSADPIKLNIRVIAATNKNLQLMVSEGKFREDLLYRLNVLNLRIPPLRERPEDIAPIVKHFVDNINATYNFKKSFSEQALKRLAQYDWPGNVRQLKNLVERLIILSENNEMEEDDVIDLLYDNQAEEATQQKQLKINNMQRSASLIDEYSMEERKRILAMLIECNGNKSKAAKRLNISRAKLYKKLEEFK